MAIELFPGARDVLCDVEWLKRKHKQLNNSWDDCKKIVEEKNIDCDYQRLLRFILGEAEMHERRKRVREHVIYIGEEDDGDGEIDPQYELFLSRLKEHDKSYAVESENNGVPVFIKYEAASGSEEELEQESRRNMIACAEQIVGLSNRKPCLLNNQTAMVQHWSDMQAQSGNTSSTRCARILMNLVEGENVKGRESELSTQKPGFWTNGLMQNQRACNMQILSSRKRNVQNCRTSKSEWETLVQVHDELLLQKSRTRNNWLTENESDRDDQAGQVEKNKVQSRIKSSKVVKGDHGADNEALIQIDEGNMYQKPGRRNSWVTENLCNPVDPAQPGEKDEVQNQRKLKKVAWGSNVVKGDLEISKRSVVQIDNQHPYLELGPGNNRLVKYQSENAGQARIGGRNKFQNPRKKYKVVEGTNLVKVEYEPDKIDVIETDNIHICQKPGPRNNWVKESTCGHSDQAQPGKNDKVHSQIYLQQLGKRRNVVCEDDRANRKEVVRTDNEHLHQKPSQKNNCLTEYQNEHVDQAQPVNKYAEEMDRKSKGKNMVEGYHKAKKKTMFEIDSKNFYQDPGPRNNRVARNYSECIDLIQPGTKHGVHEQRELMKVVQRDHELSNQKTAFRNCAVKKEPHHSVKVSSGREGIDNKMRNVKDTKCLVKYKNCDQDNLDKEDDDETVPEVEILDSAAYIKKGVLSPFVPSKRFHKSMVDDDFQNRGRLTVCDEFRKEVLKVLRKPYDKEEYNRHREAIRVGCYLHHYPGLGKKLKKYRYKRGKCLIILRGFFFWLQNLTREGAFKPWNDRQCLAVEPPSV